MTDRNAEISERRARRAARGDGGMSRRLAVDTTKLDTEKFTYRWVADNGSRMQVLKEHEDYEIAPEGVKKTTGTQEDGSRQTSVLMRKPRELHDDDKAAAQAEIDENEIAIREGHGPATGPQNYVPRDTPIEIGGKKTASR